MKSVSITSSKSFLISISGILINMAILMTVLIVWTLISANGFVNYALIGVTMISTASLILSAMLATDEWTAWHENNISDVVVVEPLKEDNYKTAA